MILNRKQELGLAIAAARYAAHEPYTCISGYAGSGKTTLVSHIVSALGFLPEEVAYVAFTGKAADVLRQKGCPNAKTAHKLLYDYRPLPSGKFMQIPKKELDYPYKMLIVDEVSMLPNELWQLLLSHGIYVLACGDPYQIPPIDPNEDNHVLDHPHIFLDEIMRQAQESEIIRLSMHLREGRPAATFKAENKEVMIVSPLEITDNMYLWADQILCATNATRNQLNAKMRELKGFGHLPQPEDRVIGLRNHWDELSDQGNALTNGSIGYLEEMRIITVDLPRRLRYNKSFEMVSTRLRTEEGDRFYNLMLDYHYLMTGESLLTPEQEYWLKKDKTFIYPQPYQFAFGYAITCHKSQGSQWNKVLVREESFPRDRIEHSRWCYTASTRATNKLVFVRQ